MLFTINAETFFQKNVAKIEVTCRNKGILRNWHIFVPLIVRTLIIHVLHSETFSLHAYEKVPKICKIVVYFEVTFSRNIFFAEKLRQLKKRACSTSETNQKYIITHVLTNLKTCNSINPLFIAFLRLPLSIQKYFISYYTVQYDFSFAIRENCAYFSLGITMKDNLNETILVLLHKYEVTLLENV